MTITLLTDRKKILLLFFKFCNSKNFYCVLHVYDNLLKYNMKIYMTLNVRAFLFFMSFSEKSFSC